MKRTRERERGTKEETRSERESPPSETGGGQEATSKAHTKRRLEEEKKAETGDTGKTKKEGGDKMRER